MTDISDTSRIEIPSGPPPEPPPGPIAQSVAIGFRAVYVVTLLLAVVWLGSNIRQIAPDKQVVVMRFERIVRVQESGLLLALPRPFEQVLLLPGPDSVLSQAVGSLPATGGITLPSAQDTTAANAPSNAAPYLTGDGNVVLLDAKVIYRIVDPRAYVLSKDHVAPALDRLFRATAVRVTAGYGLNDFLVVQTDAAGAGAQSTIALRAAVRDDLLAGMNAKLQQLNAQGVGIGVRVDRIDLTPSLPPEALIAFNAVLTAAQAADQQIAAARTAGELRRQGAEREGDRLTSAAQATASELTTSATVDTATIKALVAQETSQTRESLMLRAYTERVADIMNRVGSVTLIDPQNGARFVLPGRQP